MATISYDFSNRSDILGQMPPEVELGYEPTEGESIVISDARSFGDGATSLRIWNGGGGASHSFARVTDPLPLVGGDCEIFGRCLARPDDSNPEPNNIATALLAFGNNGGNTEFSWRDGFNFRVRSHEGTTGGGLFDQSDEVVAGIQYAPETWVEFLVKRTGDLIEVWHWEAGQAEPSTPQISYTENKNKDNELRLTGRRNGSHWDFVGVGTEGDPAPRSAEVAPEEITGSTTAPYTGLWTPSAAGIYRVTAKFTTAEGSTQESDPVDFEVQDPE